METTKKEHFYKKNTNQDSFYSASQRSLLPVDTDEQEYQEDTNLPPASGYDYLRRVRQEASNCPDVVTATIDPRKLQTTKNRSAPLPSAFTQSMSASIPHTQRKSKTNSKGNSEQSGMTNEDANGAVFEEQMASKSPLDIPSRKWEEGFLQEFRDMRNLLQKYLESKPKSTPPKLPKPNDKEGWYIRLYGTRNPVVEAPIQDLEIEEEIEPVDSVHDEQDETQEEDEDVVTMEENKESEKVEAGTEDDGGAADLTGEILDEGIAPMLCLVRWLDQTKSLNLLEFHMSWIVDEYITERQAQWLYALLLRLDPLLTAQQISLLRDLCRKCIRLRDNIADIEDPQQAYLDMIIAVIVKVFGQVDLGNRME